MSNGIIHATEVANNVTVLWLAVMLIFVGIVIISSCIMAYYAKKARKHDEEVQRLEKERRESDGYIPRELETEIMDEDDENLKAQKQMQAQIKEEKRLKDKYREKYNKVDTWGQNAAKACIVFWCMITIIFIIISHSIGGSVHTINPVTDVNNNGVIVNAYYKVTYVDVEQDTLTVFVKNESKKPLYKATIVEKNTGASTTIENLDLGQEKITSIVVYPTDDDKYEFEVKDVEYYE